MPKRIDNSVAHRAWNFVRMALLWARKRGIFNRRLIMGHLPLVPKFMKTLGHPTQSRHLPYGERQLSFNDTPVFPLKTHHLGSAQFHLPHIPCINRPVDSDQECTLFDCNDQVYSCKVVRICDDAEDGINARADEFIAKFYEQLKLQRQISYLQWMRCIVEAKFNKYDVPTMKFFSSVLNYSRQR